MKVLSYLQICHEGGIVDIALYLHKADMSNSVTDFYAQSFKPELITELFEGWDLIDSEFWNDSTIGIAIDTVLKYVKSKLKKEKR